MVQQIQQPGPLVWINAFAGVGKLTIARELVKLMGGQKKVILIDNHTLIDVVKLTRDHADYQPQRREVRQACFDRFVICDASSSAQDRGKTIVFTDFQSSNELGHSVAREYEDAARRAGRRFVPVYLECGKEETVRRATLPERSVEGKGKLVDEAVLRAFLDTMRLFEFEGVEGLRLDVTTQSPAEVAAELAGLIGS
ncbi:hypothetical protein AB5N19_07351 [Seiridium cardinale]